MISDVNEYNRRVHEGLNLFRRGKFKTCLFGDECTEPVVQAHSVSRAVLADLEENGHVIRPMIRTGYDKVGRSYPDLGFQLEGINRASTGTFVCRTHDGAFTEIDTIPIDFDNPRVCDLLFFRAILKDAWQLLRTQIATMWFERDRPWPGPLPTHPNTRLRALLNAMELIRPSLDSAYEDAVARPAVHLVRRMRTEHPIVAASCAGGGSALAFDQETGREIDPKVVHSIMGKDPNSCWSFTVIPQVTEHVMVASWLRNSIAENYFQHFNEVQGEELQAAVSAELIIFCENWYLNPKIWRSFSRAKQAAIIDAYNNFAELQTGRYIWSDREDKAPWFKYLNLSNRHQINFFRYNKVIFAH